MFPLRCRAARVTCLAALLLAMSIASNSTAEPSRASARRTIVALGDSLTSGYGLAPEQAYPALLQRRLRDAGWDYHVRNAGISGNTSADGLRRVTRDVPDDTALLIVALGVNDGLRGVPVATVRANLAAILDHARSRDIPVLLCANEALPIHGWDYTVAFHRMYRDLAAAYDVPLAPFLLTNVFGRRELLLPDMAHPNAAGARVMADHLWPHLERRLRELEPERTAAGG